MTFHKAKDEYLINTGESPKGFKGVLVVVRDERGVESAKPVAQLGPEVDPHDIPEAIYKAWVDKGLAPALTGNDEAEYADDHEVVEYSTEPEPEPEPARPKRKPKRKYKSKEQMDDEHASYVCHVAAGLDHMTACAASGFLHDDVDHEPLDWEPPAGLIEWAGFLSVPLAVILLAWSISLLSKLM